VFTKLLPQIGRYTKMKYIKYTLEKIYKINTNEQSVFFCWSVSLVKEDFLANGGKVKKVPWSRL
jgi:hypothetical protein